MKVQINDGGRSKYFDAKKVGDCVTRAVAIATGKDYKEVYNAITKLVGYTPRNGVHKKDTKKVMKHFGGQWFPTMEIGKGCTTHLKDGEVPMGGRIVCNLSGHVCAVIDGVINDTFDPSRNGKRCVYGYWVFGADEKKEEETELKGVEEICAAAEWIKKQETDFAKNFKGGLQVIKVWRQLPKEYDFKSKRITDYIKENPKKLSSQDFAKFVNASFGFRYFDNVPKRYKLKLYLEWDRSGRYGIHMEASSNWNEQYYYGVTRCFRGLNEAKDVYEGLIKSFADKNGECFEIGFVGNKLKEVLKKGKL